LERAGELCVNDLAATVEMAPQAVSNQLQRMADRGIVVGRREGSSIIYCIADPCVTALLELGLCQAEDARAARDREAV
jgi:DNA-binding transcriptional ArsR family regulator